MASKFLVPDRAQSFLRATSYQELVGESDPVWTVIEVVEGLDLSSLYARYAVSAAGRPAFDPTMMLTLLIFGYAEGKRSSRELESACRRDVAYQAICGGMTPDHATIARFRVLIDDELEGLFIQVVAECARRGLVEVGRVAVDGTKIEAAASKESNYSAGFLTDLEAEIRRVLAETETEIDTEIGIEIDAGVGVNSGNLVGSADDAPDTDTDTGNGNGNDGDTGGGDSSGKGGGGWSRRRRRRETRRCLDRVDAAQREVQAAQQRREADLKRRGRTRRGEATANLVDPDSRLQKTRDGWIQGYNAQALVSADQIVIAAEVTAETTDVAMLEPMLDQTIENLTAAGVAEPVGTVLADAGYWSHHNFKLEEQLNARLLIATGKQHQVGDIDDFDAATASAAAGARHQMQLRLAADKEIYQQRGWLIEGTFAHTKTHRRSRRFQRRGLIACNAEWKLIHIAGNILKIHRRRRCIGPRLLDRRVSRPLTRLSRPDRPPNRHQPRNRPNLPTPAIKRHSPRGE